MSRGRAPDSRMPWPSRPARATPCSAWAPIHTVYDSLPAPCSSSPTRSSRRRTRSDGAPPCRRTRRRDSPSPHRCRGDHRSAGRAPGSGGPSGSLVRSQQHPGAESEPFAHRQTGRRRREQRRGVAVVVEVVLEATASGSPTRRRGGRHRGTPGKADVARESTRSTAGTTPTRSASPSARRRHAFVESGRMRSYATFALDRFAVVEAAEVAHRQLVDVPAGGVHRARCRRRPR